MKLINNFTLLCTLQRNIIMLVQQLFYNFIVEFYSIMSNFYSRTSYYDQSAAFIKFNCVIIFLLKCIKEIATTQHKLKRSRKLGGVRKSAAQKLINSCLTTLGNLFNLSSKGNQSPTIHLQNKNCYFN